MLNFLSKYYLSLCVRLVCIPLYLFLILFTFTACTTVPTRSIQTYNSVEIDISKPDRTVYYLVDKSNKRKPVLATSYVRSGKLSFRVPTSQSVGQCLHILNQRGENIYSDSRSIYPSLALNYTNLLTEKTNLEKSLREITDKENRANKTLKSLEDNKAYKYENCVAPDISELPPKQPFNCMSKEECQVTGIAYCLVRFEGTRSCNEKISSYFEISSEFSSAICSSAIQQVLDGQVTLGNALESSIISYLKNHDNLIMNLFGLIGTAGVFNRCIDKYAQQNYYEGPQQLYARCNNDKQNLNYLTSQLTNSQENKRKISEEIKLANSRLIQTQNSREQVSFCTPNL